MRTKYVQPAAEYVEAAAATNAVCCNYQGGVADQLVPLLEVGAVAVLAQDVEVGEVSGEEFLLAGCHGASRLYRPLPVGIVTSTTSPAWTV